MRLINRAALDLIKSFEGLRLEAYQDPAGIWTIGYGHTRGVRPGQTIDEAEAERLLRQDLRTAAGAVERHVGPPLNDNEFGALVSFVFNVGEGAFASSTLLKRLNAGDRGAVPDQLRRWDKATVGGKKVQLRGLARRRAAEALLWATPPEPEPEMGSGRATTAAQKPLSKSVTIWGSIGAGAGVIGSFLSDTAAQLQPLVGYAETVKTLFLLLSVAGIALAAYGRWRVHQREGV